jgi:hypothetical protein
MELVPIYKGSAIPYSCARLQRISEATDAPRCAWSSARPSSNIFGV